MLRKLRNTSAKGSKVRYRKSFLVMDIAIVVLTLVLCFLGFGFYMVYSEYHTPKFEERQLLTEISEQDYGLAIQWKQSIEHGQGLTDDENFAQAAALCDYIEADYFKPIYEKEQNQSKLARLQVQKSEAEQKIGIYKTLLSEIDQKFPS